MTEPRDLRWPDPAAAADLAAMRAAAPLVHCITNIVAASITANVLLAIGAAPAMVNAPEEAAPFAAIAGALLVNLGTVSEATAEAMRVAARSAQAAGRPWVLDPVAVGGLPLRDRVAAEILQYRPAIIRGNALRDHGAGRGSAGGGAGRNPPRDPNRLSRPRVRWRAAPVPWSPSAAWWIT